MPNLRRAAAVRLEIPSGSAQTGRAIASPAARMKRNFRIRSTGRPSRYSIRQVLAFPECITDGQEGQRSRSYTRFHHWADAQRQRLWDVAFLARYVLGCLLLWISSGCIALARIVASTP